MQVNAETNTGHAPVGDPWALPVPLSAIDQNIWTVEPSSLITILRQSGLSIATAESLTGGGLCARLVDVSGASDVVLGGICTYATSHKTIQLQVDPELLASHGPVHPRVAAQMAQGVQRLFRADVAIATTGVAGPGPADGHCAGTVFIACLVKEHLEVAHYQLSGERNQVRDLAIRAAICLTEETLRKKNSRNNA